jgi:GNAT superfamily N-acetyltransferase
MIVAMNGHGGFGGNAEPLIQYCFAPIGPPDDYRRITLSKSVFSPILSCAEAFGTVLEMRVEDEGGGIVTAAACTAFHPGSLEEGSVMKTGSDRYYYSLTSSGAPPMFMDRNFCGGDKPIQRFAAMKQDSQLDTKRKERGPMWYIGCLGTHPLHQGKGYARRLLDVVAIWAERDGVECYLECAAENVAFYKKCGYREVWKADINVAGEDSVLFVHGMARACREVDLAR